MKLLVLGASGLVGSNVARTAHARGASVVGTYNTTRPALPVPLEEVDVRDRDRVGGVIESVDPDVVLNCTGMTDVDACEQNERRARELNTAVPALLAESTRDRDTGFVHYSTDYVFDGETDGRYVESDTPSPIQVYGETKRGGEQRVLEEHPDALIPRLSFVYGIHRGRSELTGFVGWLVDQLTGSEPFTLVDDQWVSPSRAGQIAATTLDLIEVGASGIVHTASQSCLTPLDMGEIVAASLENPATFDRCTRADLPYDAPRPRRTCLSLDRVEGLLNRQQPTVAADLESLPLGDYI